MNTELTCRDRTARRHAPLLPVWSLMASRSLARNMHVSPTEHIAPNPHLKLRNPNNDPNARKVLASG